MEEAERVGEAFGAGTNLPLLEGSHPGFNLKTELRRQSKKTSGKGFKPLPIRFLGMHQHVRMCLDKTSS